MSVDKRHHTKWLLRFIFFTFIGTSIFMSVRIIIAPSIAPTSDIPVRVKGDYVLMFLQCISGVFAMLIPGILKHKIRLNIPDTMLITYTIFLFCGIYLGEIRNFYYRVPHWDTALHTFSGVALGALGFSIVNLLNKSEFIAFSLSPIFVALFAFCFAVTLGVIWEIFEFSMDYFIGTNTQKWALETGEQLIGQAAIMDTMKDLIVDIIGAFMISGIGFISLKYKKGWLDRFQMSLGE